MAAIVADGVSEQQAAAMTGRDAREVKAALKAEAKTTAAGKTAAPKKPAARAAAADPPAP